MNVPPDVFVLAGGFGTRLKSAVSDVPKPMAPIGDRPFLEYLLDYWIRQGTGGIVLSVGYLAECVKSHFGNGYRGVPVSYCEEREPLGTGGALVLALAAGILKAPSFVMLNGDTLFEASLADAKRDAGRFPIAMTVKPVPGNARYGGVDFDADGRVTAFNAAGDGRGPGYINAGCYLMDRAAVAREIAGYSGKFSFESVFLPKMAEKGLLGASAQDRPFIDIGVPEDYHYFCENRRGR